MSETTTPSVENAIESDPPVTVLVTRKPLPGREAEFEAYVTGITQAAMRHPGHLGANVFRPNKPGGEYRIVFKFDRRSHLEQWERSDERAQWHEIAETVSEPRKVETLTGLEAWFTLPNCPVNLPPPRYKMAFLVWLGVFSLVTLLSYLIGPLMAEWPLVARTFTLTLIVVFTLTYLVMPLLTRLFARWLYPNR